MKWILYFHPESDCLFWSKDEMDACSLCEEIGRSETNTKDDARKLFFDSVGHTNENEFNKYYHGL